MATIAVIGAGPQGRSFSAACARAGHRTILEDVLPSRLRDAQNEIADVRIELVSTVEDAVREADFAIDFVPDELESKLELVCMMDRMAPPKTILLIHTAALDADDLARCTYRAAKSVGIRFARDGVAITRCSETSQVTTEAVQKLMESLGL